MIRYVVITIMLLGVGVLGLAAEEPNRAIAAPTPQVHLQVHLIERLRDESSAKAGGSSGKVLTPAEAKAFLQELRASPGAKTLAEPALRVKIGEKGTFRSGGEFVREVANSNPGEPPLKMKEFFGTAVDATVTLPKPGLLSVALRCEQSERIDKGQAGQPGKNSREVQTRVDLQSGQTVVLNGLLNHHSVTIETRQPVLGDIPVIGRRLFAHRRTETQSSELVVLVTATLVDETTESSQRH